MGLLLTKELEDFLLLLLRETLHPHTEEDITEGRRHVVDDELPVVLRDLHRVSSRFQTIQVLFEEFIVRTALNGSLLATVICRQGGADICILKNKHCRSNRPAIVDSEENAEGCFFGLTLEFELAVLDISGVDWLDDPVGHIAEEDGVTVLGTLGGSGDGVRRRGGLRGAGGEGCGDAAAQQTSGDEVDYFHVSFRWLYGI